MKTLNSGDLIYLPSHFILTKKNKDGTVKEYCELKEPYVSVLLRKRGEYSDLFYRGSVWTAPNDMLLGYAVKGESYVSYVN
tara:strand:- start:712 stop:954 length:243 start_codon:yes stop_codon:yes gene_type:complete